MLSCWRRFYIRFRDRDRGLCRKQMDPKRVSAAIGELGGDPALQEALSEELQLLFACPQ